MESGNVTRAGQKRRLTSEFTGTALQLSNQLKINELEAVDLLSRAYQLQPRFPGVAAITIAETQYYEQREYLLRTLLHLFAFRASSRNPSTAAAVVTNFTTRLLNEQFFAHLIEMTQSRVDLSQNEATPACAQASRLELRLLCQLVFAIAYHCSLYITESDAGALLRLVRHGSNLLAASLLKSQPPPKSLAAFVPSSPLVEPQSSLVFSTALLSAAMIAYLDPLATLGGSPDTVNPSSISLPKVLARDGVFQKELIDAKKTWQHEPIRGVLLLVSALSGLHHPATQELSNEIRATDRAKEATQSSCFVCLEHICSALVLGYAQPAAYLCAIEEVFAALLHGIPQHVRDLKQEEEESLRKVQIYNNYPYGAPPAEPSRHFEQLLIAMAHVYECLIETGEKEQWQPLTARYWDGINYPELNQFLRMCGDNIFQDIFVPVLRFLRVMASGQPQARRTHDFLQERRQHVSWASFFSVLRHTALAFQENAAPGSGGQPGAATTGTSVIALRPEDLAGMTAMVQLIATVVQSDDSARGHLIKSADSPLETLFGLLACPVPPSLKAAILHAARAFSVDPEVAARSWQLMASIQLLPPPGATGGIRAELIDIESSNETYPCTAAFLQLVHLLVGVSLVADPAPPPTPQELWHHVVFIERDVFSVIDQRPFKNPHEKADLTLSALLLVSRLVQAALSSFFLQPAFHSALTNSAVLQSTDTMGAQDKLSSVFSSFQEATVARLAAEAPAALAGLRLISTMLVPGNPITRKLLTIVAQGVDALTEIRGQPRGATTERCVLASLSILHAVLENQSLFLSNYDIFAHAWTRGVSSSLASKPGTASATSDSGKSGWTEMSTSAFRAAQELGTAPLEPLDRQLLSQADKLVALLRYVEYSENELVNKYAIKITEQLCSKGEFSMSVVRALLDKQQQPHLVAAYSLLLELPEGVYPITPLEPESQSASVVPGLSREHSLRSLAVEMMICCAKQPAPNFAQVLVGLNPVAATAFVTGSNTQLAVAARTPLEVVVSILNDPELVMRQSDLATQCYHLLFVLLQQSPTRGRIATLLRSRYQDFFYVQLFQMILQRPPELHESAERLEGLGWLLKSVALELHLTRGTGHRSYTQRILGFMFGLQTQAETPSGSGGGTAEQPTAQLQLQFQYGQDVQQQRMKMRELLESALAFLSSATSPPEMSSLLRDPLLQGVNLARATVLDSLQVPLIDVKELMSIVREQQQPGSRDDGDSFGLAAQTPSFLFNATPQQTAPSAATEKQQDIFFQRIGEVLHQAVAINRFQKTVGALCHAFEGWKEVLAVTLGECFHLMDLPTRAASLYELQDVLLQNLQRLLRVTSEVGLDPAMEVHLSKRLGVPMSQCLALLLAKLRQQIFTSAAESTNRASHVDLTRHGESPQPDGMPPPDQLLVLLHGLVSCLVQTDCYLPLRLNLYSALIHYLQIVIRLRDTMDADEFRVVFGETTAILRRVGSRLIDLVASDACDASDGQKLIPFGLLTVIIPHFDVDGSWLEHLSRHNYIHQFVDHIVRQDELLVAGDARAVYVFESEMALLTAIASAPASDGGASQEVSAHSLLAAQVLIDNKVFQTLSRCSFMEQRPEDRMLDDTLASRAPLSADQVSHRSDVLLQAVLRLSQIVMIKLHQNEEAARQVSHLFAEHGDAVVAVLKDPYSTSLETLVVSPGSLDRLESAITSLTTLASATAVLGALAHFPHILSSTMAKRLSQFDQLQLELISKYTSIEERLTRLNRGISPSAVRLRPHINAVIRNILLYLRVRCSAAPPKLTAGSKDVAAPTLFALLGSNSKQPSYTVLITLLQQTIMHWESATARMAEVRSFQSKLDSSRVEELAEQLERLRASGHLDHAELMAQVSVIAPYHSQYRYQRGLIDQDVLSSLTAPQRSRLTSRLWQDQLAKLQEQSSALLLNIEHLLFLLWHHIAPALNAQASKRPSAASLPLLSSKERLLLANDLSHKLGPQVERLGKSSGLATPFISTLSSRFRDVLQTVQLSKA